MTNIEILQKLELPEGKLRMVLDTDTYNEVDDQFALTYAARSPERLNLEAVYAAPFFNDNSKSPADGMEKSYDEIKKILDLIKYDYDENFVLRGSDKYLPDGKTPVDSPAARDLVARAMGSEETLYVVAIGAITNVASAILMEPRITEKIVLVWLGGHSYAWPHTREFNLMQDIPASRVIFDSGVPLVQLPCMGVVSECHTSVEELERHIDGKSEIGTYLTSIVREYRGRWKDNALAYSKVIWDICAVAYLINPKWVPTQIMPSPILTDQCTYSADGTRHLIKSAFHVDRDRIFTDVFGKINL